MGMQGFAGRIRDFFGIRKSLSDELFDDLTDILVEGDFGAAGAYKIVEELRELCKKEKITDPEEARLQLARLLEELLGEARKGKAVPLPEEGFRIILLLGVNGVGKTTTAAKLADYYRAVYRKQPILAAADTFRAAAIDQLKIHGKRLGVRVVAHQHGGDPAAVVYDAIEAAAAGDGDLIIADTAGRMHTKSALVDELKKIDRVVESRAGEAAYVKWLVLDATTGRNALSQAETFHGAVAPGGVVLTKFDSGARGGAVFSLAQELGLPVVFLCHGEKYGDIRPFDPHDYARDFVGLA
ncbi:MAG: signal recognition particle-docking protein FtsY [Treponema sp.]|nr:signal recognition particle-docking protein FtsY [Treponema sp.]